MPLLRLTVVARALVIAALCALPAGAQHRRHAGDSAAHHARGAAGVGAQGVALVTRAAPALGGETLAEGYLAQPVVMAHGPIGGRGVRFAATVNFEGLTLRRGQLNAGAYGEGYVDRRHPHTLVHEAMVSYERALPRLTVGVPDVRVSLAAGKGFVAFGTDDPMNRPFALFPVNHHLAQILERAVAVVGARAGSETRGLAVEGSLFNGDEPWDPWSWPRLGRFGDSWALRATLTPARAAELSGSAARLTSPENRAGGGLDQRKASVAARWARGTIVPGAPGEDATQDAEYALVEWARTDEHRGARRVFRYQSVLAEGAVRRRGVQLALRAERTARPEEERLLDPFRSVRPHFEGNVLGVTEWRVLSAAASARVPLGGALAALGARPFVEVARQSPREVIRPSAFEPPLFYGARTLWTLSAGVRVGLGAGHARMGRYGVTHGAK